MGGSDVVERERSKGVGMSRRGWEDGEDGEVIMMGDYGWE